MVVPDPTSVVGENDTYLLAKYKQWCLSNPDLVCYEDSQKVSRETFIKHYIDSKAETFFEDLLNSDCKADVKSDEKAKQHRESGNEAYKSKKNMEALQEYTNALLYCEDQKSETMAMAYANRSAVLMAIGSNEALVSAIRDAHRAVDCQYPASSVYKLYDRIGRCYYKLKRMDQAVAAFKKALESLEVPSIAEETKAKLKKDIEKIMRPLVAKVGANAKLEEVKVEGEALVCPKLACPDKQFPSFSVSMRVVDKGADKGGRQVVAKRTIKAGETVCVETPIASFLDLAERGKSTCTNCFNQAWDPLPSPISTQDVFCCQMCIKVAVETYHSVETRVADYLRGCELTDKSDWFLGLRAIAQKPLEYFLENKGSLFTRHDPTYGANLREEEVYGGYKGLFNLVDNDSALQSAKKQFRAFVAFFICSTLEKGGYFKTSSNLDEDKLFIACLLDHFMGAASMNCHEVGRYTVPTGLPEMEGVIRSFGTSIEPTMDLINHSCNPAIMRYNVGHTIVAVAVRDVPEGEEVTDCYYKTYYDEEKSSRRSYLAKYCFDCKCDSCGNSWATALTSPRALVDIPDNQLKFDLSDEKDAMAVKGAFDRINRVGTKIAMEQKQGNVEAVLPLCLEFRTAVEAAIKPPHNFYVMSFRSYFKSNWILKGSVEKMQQ